MAELGKGISRLGPTLEQVRPRHFKPWLSHLVNRSAGLFITLSYLFLANSYLVNSKIFSWGIGSSFKISTTLPKLGPIY